QLSSVNLYLPSPPVPSSDPVTVTTSKAKVEVHENTNAVLSCEFRTEKETNPRVEWKKRGKDVSYVYFDGDFTGSFKGRASIDGATLTLRGVTQKDSGVYHCEVTARQDKIKLGEVTVTLNVLVPPHAPSCEVPETVMRGFSAELRCKDKLSVPAATYSWYKDNKPLHTANLPEINYTLDPKTGTLKFKAVSKSDEGQYRCEASNGVGAPKSCAGRHMKITECSLEHLLSSCPKALADGRYRWRHDQVLKAIAESLASAISTSKYHHAPKKAVHFIKAGEKHRVRPQLTTGLLHKASDWQLQVDLGKQLRFPQHIVTTSLRPDMIVTSEVSKQLIMLELTVPWEERIEEANERKRAKYQELVEKCRERGWRTFYEPIEVGCRGFAGRSLCKVLSRLGITGVAKKRAIQAASEAAEKATRWLWFKRADPWAATGTQVGA
uniref:Junctional adhesion molecule 2b n=1 Tax=Sinocyclocheilus rhinocerous TaxID=307959 RepID=A0A673L1F3_9TELE